MKFIELFAGIGGFRLALNRLGHECVWANEWDKYAGSIYNKRFGSITNDKIGGTRTFTNIDARDIKTVSTEEIPDHDLLVGGFPCQAFSIAGKRRGFDDTRGTLFFEIARILKDKQPKFFILENVKGLLSHDKGDTFKIIISTLTELRYDLQWQVLNSKNFGVPQNRERVFIVGHLRETSRPEVFPLEQDDNPLTTKGGEQPSNAVVSRTLTATDAKMHLDGNYVKGLKQIVGGSQGYRVYDPSGISSTLAGEAGGIGAKTGLYAMRWQRTEKGKEARKRSQKLGKDYTPFSNGHRELVPVEGKTVGALTSQAIAKDSLIDNEYKIRRLTPTECERLQSFPDSWTKYGVNEKGEEVAISDTQRYKVLGNAVTVSVVHEIAKRLGK